MGTEQLNCQRELLRSLYKQKRLQIPNSLWQSRSQLVCDQIARWQIFQTAPVIFSFISHQREPDLGALSSKFPHKTWALPRCHQDQLQFHVVDGTTELIPNCWGILEPPASVPVISPDEATLCLVPGLVFDRGGYRLGFGKGYYDRFFASHPNCIKVGVLFTEFVVNDICPKAWDVKMDYLAHDRSVDPVQK